MGRMIYCGLPEVVEDVSRGLSKGLLEAPNRLNGLFEPEGPWRWDGPEWRGARNRRSYWYRASTTLNPEQLRPQSFEDLLLSYVNTDSYPQPIRDVDVYLTYRDDT